MNIGQLTMWVLEFEGFYGKPKPLTIEDQSLQYLHKQIGLCTKGSFHEGGKYNYIKVLKYFFSLRLLCEYFMLRIMRVLYSQSFS
jgi:hypothetical protein